jgi:hypothetical protein
MIPLSASLILAACFVPNMEQFLGNKVVKRLQCASLGVGEVEVCRWQRMRRRLKRAVDGRRLVGV